MTNKLFEICFDELMKFEGGYVNDPQDPGGETKYGISKRAYPELDIKNLTIDKAKVIFKRDYWDQSECEKLPPSLAIMVFDCAVNSGNKKAIILLQSCVGAGVDGLIGIQTLSMANRCYIPDVIKEYSNRRLVFLKSLTSWPRFGKGWEKRVKDIERLAVSLLSLELE